MPDEVSRRRQSDTSSLIAHLEDLHGFGFDDVGVPPQPVLHEIHAELHEQENEHHLPTHRHRWEVVDVHSDRCVSPQFDQEQEAEEWALGEFGSEAGKEYVIQLACDVAES